MKYRVLVIFELIPDRLDLFALEVTQAEFLLLQSFHNCYINDTKVDEETQDRINRFFFLDNGYFRFSPLPPEQLLTDVRIDLIIRTGMYV